MERLSVPPDAWKGIYIKMARSIEAATKLTRVRLYVKAEENQPMLDYRIEGTVYDTAAPARIEYCEVPSSGRVDSPCGYQSKTCTGTTSACQWCQFTYCERHLVFHIYRIVVPWGLWKTMRKRIEKAAERVIEADGKRLFRVAPAKTILRRPEGPA